MWREIPSTRVAIRVLCTTSALSPARRSLTAHQKNIPVVDMAEYQCSICKLHYKDKGPADECHTWCSTHDSCNLKIAEQSIEAEERRKKHGN